MRGIGRRLLLEQAQTAKGRGLVRPLVVYQDQAAIDVVGGSAIDTDLDHLIDASIADIAD